MKRFRSYQYSSSSNNVKIGIAIVILLLLSNVILLYFFVKERNINKNLFILIDRTNNDFNQIHESLKKKDLQSAFRHLADAQKQVVSMLPAQPSPSQKVQAEKKGTPPVQTTQAKAAPPQTLAAIPTSNKETPYPFVFADSGEYLLICEKDTKII